jgi:nucleoside-diphosphate-sugar epimerase
MKILITGGAGCLGSSIIEKYLPEGNEILVIDNFATGKKEVLPEIKGLTVIEGSVYDEALVNKAFADFKPTHVINSAASYKDITNWAEDANTNILGSIYVAKASLDHGVEKVVNFQTALCYGRPKETPIPVTHPTAPFTSYGISKTAGEKYLLQSGLPVVSLRLSNICGPRLSIGPIPTFYKRLKAGQSVFCSDTVRDFLDISDFMSLMDIILAPGSDVTGVYNVSTGEGHSIKDVFDEVSAYVGVSMPDVPILPVGDDDVQAVVLDPSETEASFSWKAKVDFKNTILRQLEWYDKYGVNDIYSHLTAQGTK